MVSQRGGWEGPELLATADGDPACAVLLAGNTDSIAFMIHCIGQIKEVAWIIKLVVALPSFTIPMGNKSAVTCRTKIINVIASSIPETYEGAVC